MLDTLDREKKVVLFSFMSLLLIIILLFIFLIWPSSSPAKRIATVSPVTTTSRPGSLAAASTTSTSTSSTTTSSSTTTTSTTRPTTTTSPTTTTTVPFAATSNATKTNEVINDCINEQFTFNGSTSANHAGTVTWTWVRWDGAPTNVSGTTTFTSNGTPSSAITPYVLSVTAHSDVTGWAALQLTWTGGSYTSAHADFSYSHTAVNLGIQAMGC